MSAPTVLFDLDGTLTDPAAGITAALRAAFAATGLDVAGIGGLERFIGPPLQEIFAGLGLGPNETVSAISAYRAYYSEQGLYENTVYPAVPPLLARLVGRGCRLAVATSKPRVFAERIVAHFGLDRFFSVVAGPELDGQNRHKHEVIALALDALRPGARPLDTPGRGKFMVGDRLHDMVGARRTGLLPIGVTWGYGSREELLDAGAAHLVDHPGQLDALLVGDAIR